MILIIISEIYPVAEPDALIDIVYVDVVAPLDVVQKGSNADQQRVEDDHRTSRKERTKQVVVPLTDTPQKRDCRLPPEQVNTRTTTFQRTTLPVLVRARTGTGTQERNTTVKKLLPSSWMCMCESNAAITQRKSTPWHTTHLHFIVT